MTAQPNGIQQSNLPGVTIGDYSDDTAQEPPAGSLLMATTPAPATGQVATWNGEEWIPETPSAGGSVSITDGTTTVDPATELDFTSGATVTDAGGGVAQVAITGGGGGAGPVQVHRAPFAWNTPNIATGATLVFGDGYDAPIGDILLDAWFEIDTAWDGTNPLADFGPLTDTFQYGIFAQVTGGGGADGFAGVPMITADSNAFGGEPSAKFLQGLSWSGPLSGLQSLVLGTSNFGDSLYAVAGAAVNLDGNAYFDGQRWLPLKFVTDDPLKVVVNQSAQGGGHGTPSDSTVGASYLYIVTATPA